MVDAFELNQHIWKFWGFTDCGQSSSAWMCSLFILLFAAVSMQFGQVLDNAGLHEVAFIRTRRRKCMAFLADVNSNSWNTLDRSSSGSGEGTTCQGPGRWEVIVHEAPECSFTWPHTKGIVSIPWAHLQLILVHDNNLFKQYKACQLMPPNPYGLIKDDTTRLCVWTHCLLKATSTGSFCVLPSLV